MLYLTELKPEITKQKSFYKKAMIQNTNFEVYTQTTLKHLKEFLYQTLGITGLKKKEIMKLVQEF